MKSQGIMLTLYQFFEQALFLVTGPVFLLINLQSAEIPIPSTSCRVLRNFGYDLLSSPGILQRTSHLIFIPAASNGKYKFKEFEPIPFLQIRYPSRLLILPDLLHQKPLRIAHYSGTSSSL
jgi:hypothetical protein